MSTIFDIEQNKIKCQIFTPSETVIHMLDVAQYRNGCIKKRVLENSFGNGAFLKGLIKILIAACKSKNIDALDISNIIKNNIYGVELDQNLYNQTIKDLNQLLIVENIPIPEWNLFNRNALMTEYDCQFDLIIGNPPYISYENIDCESRSYLKKNYISCSKGKFDYCYAFIELGIRKLKKGGKLVQIVPTNIFKNVFAHELRELMKDGLVSIEDFPTQKIFGPVLTSPTIFLYKKNSINKIISYINHSNNEVLKIPKSYFDGNKWIFSKKSNKNSDMLRFGDYFKASMTVATQRNNIFIVNKKTIVEHKIEPNVLKRAASTRALRYNTEEFIIFPYCFKEEKLYRFAQAEFEKEFPNTAKYLNKHRIELDARDSDKSSLWFEYGRSQALSHLNQKKILLSTIITNMVILYNLDEETIPYSGIFVTIESNSKFTLEDAYKILKSDDFYEYVQQIGIRVSGNSIRITSNDINNYTFTL